ncbi:MAG: O-antigen ligase family protein [Candidatus Omnitrophica bacterium]|nr:O-antigen ligase family protein [Candidatus Omnitrophota bacterium]MDD5236050.1 O-antigen ligase family protein [Candidatus Omnitrophota bacterium]MDD5609924.1 O-antigen ligase family protein [Candidatus Omnitrophota bacterium]
MLILVFARPFIASPAFPYLNSIYVFFLFLFFTLWIIRKGLGLKDLGSLKQPAILFIAFLLASLVFSTDRLNSLEEIYKYAGGIILFFIARSLPDKDKSRLTRAILLAGLIISVLALYQYFFGVRHTLEYINKYKITDTFILATLESKRIFFPFITPNILAGYLGMILPLALLYKDRLWFIIPIVAAILLAKSVGALLSVFLGGVVYLYLEAKLDRKKMYFLFAFLIAILIVFFLRSAGPQQHLQPLFSLNMRWGYWKDTFKMILEHPLTGVGLGNFNLMQSRYAHNSFLQLCAEIGIFGFASFAWLIIAILRTGLKKGNTLYRNVLITAVAIFLIHNFFDFSFFLPEVSLVWWAILGLLL